MPYETFQQIINTLDNNSTTKLMDISFVIMHMCNINSAYNIWNKVSDKNINKFIEFISDLWSYEEENKIFQYSDLLNELISSSPNTWIGLLYQLNPNHPLLQQLDTWEKEQVITSNNIRFLNVLFHGSASEAAWAVNIYNMFYLNEQLGAKKISEILKLIDVADYSNYEARIHKEFNALNTRNKYPLNHLDIENILMKWTPESIASFINDPSKLSSMRKVSNLYEDNSVNLVDYFDVYF